MALKHISFVCDGAVLCIMKMNELFWFHIWNFFIFQPSEKNNCYHFKMFQLISSRFQILISAPHEKRTVLGTHRYTLYSLNYYCVQKLPILQATIGDYPASDQGAALVGSFLSQHVSSPILTPSEQYKIFISTVNAFHNWHSWVWCCHLVQA